MRVAFLTTDNREHHKKYDVPAPYFGTAPEALLEGFSRLPGLEVHVLSCTQKPMPASPEKLAGNIWYHSLHVPKMGWMRTGYQGCIRAVRKHLRKIQPSIVHGQGTERDCAISAVFSGFSNVLTIHGNMRLIARVNAAKPWSYLWIAAQLERITIPRSDGVVCISSYTRGAVNPLAKKTWLVPNAVDAKFFDITACPLDKEPPLVLFVGAICLRKNQNAFIRAVDALVPQLKFKVLFLGQAQTGDAYAEEFFQLVRSRSWCSYEGFADREKLRTYFQHASLLVLPSLEDNCPMTVLEAMAAGVPVLAAKVGGVPDLISDGVTGVLCDPRDLASMAAGFASCLNAPFARGLAAAAKRDAGQRFHPLTVAQQHVRIYEEVCRTRS